MKKPESFKRFLPLLFLVLFLSTACAILDQDKRGQALSPEEKAFNKAEQAFNANNQELAIRYYEDFLVNYPDYKKSPTAIFRLSTLYTAKKDFNKARELLDRLINSFSDSKLKEEAYLAYCNLWLMEDRAEKCIECIEEREDKKISPELKSRFNMLKAESFFAQKLFTRAIEELINACKKAPEQLQPYILEKILSYAEQSSPRELEKLREKAPHPEPEASLMLAQGLLLAEYGRYRAAEEMLRDFIESFPEHDKRNSAERAIFDIADKEEADPLSIACLLPLSGRFEPFGMQALKGIEIALSMYSEKADALPIRLLIEDTRSDENDTAEAIRSINSQHAIAAIGPLAASSESFYLASELKIPLISLTQQEEVSSIGPEIFRNFMSPDMQVKSLVSYLMKHRGIKKFAILHPDNLYGENFRELFWDAVENAGGTIRGVESYPDKSTDFSDSIRKLTGMHRPVPEDLLIKEDGEEEPEKEDREIKPTIDFEALFIPDSAERASLLLPQLAYHDVENVQITGTNLWHSKRFIKMAGRYSSGVIFPTGFFAEGKNPRIKEFVKIFQEHYGEEPDYLEAVAFDSLMLLLKALEEGAKSRLELVNCLKNINDFEGLTGRISFSESRKALTSPFIIEIRGYRFRELQP